MKGQKTKKLLSRDPLDQKNRKTRRRLGRSGREGDPSGFSDYMQSRLGLLMAQSLTFPKGLPRGGGGRNNSGGPGPAPNISPAQPAPR